MRRLKSISTSRIPCTSTCVASREQGEELLVSAQFGSFNKQELSPDLIVNERIQHPSAALLAVAV